MLHASCISAAERELVSTDKQDRSQLARTCILTISHSRDDLGFGRALDSALLVRSKEGLRSDWFGAVLQVRLVLHTKF